MTSQADAPQIPHPTPTPPKPAPKFHWIPILSLVAIGLVLMWHFGVFRARPKVALVTSGDTPYWDQVIAGAEEAARIYDVDLTVVRSKSITEVQSEAIRDLLDRKFSGIAISPINPAAEGPVLAEVASRTTLVTFDSDAPVSNRLCFVGTDNYGAGRICGEMVRQAIPDGGEVIISLGNLDKENTQLRRQGIIDELLERPYQPNHPIDPADQPIKGEKYTIVATLADSSEPNVATELAAKALKDHPNVKCFVGLLGYSTPALLAALEQNGKLGQVKLIGFDVNDATLAGIEAQHVYGTVMQDQFGCGFHTVRILAESARGDRSGLPTFQRRTLPVERVTSVEQVRELRKHLAGRPAATTNPT